MIILKNNAQSVLAQALSKAGTQLVVSAGDGEKFPDILLPGADWFRAALADNAGNTEYIKITERVDDRFTVVRAQENTTARAWPAGSRVQVRLTAKSWQEMNLEPWLRLVDDDGDMVVPARLSTNQFKVAGDWRQAAVPRTAVRVAGQTTVFHVTAVGYADGQTTVTVEGAALPAAMPGVELGFPASMLPAGYALTDAVNSTASNVGASAKAVKTAYDKANAALAAGGTAAAATRLAAARTIGLSGGATGTATAFDGSKNIVIPVTALDVSKATAGILPVARGGTGNATGKAADSTRWNGAAKTVSTAAPSGGANGDVWFQYI